MKNNFYPKVSIVIPVYNGSNYMRDAIDSALAQTYKNIEVIVINDGSNDNGETDEIAKSYGTRIRYFSKENGGVATALNFGIQKMTGEYFSWLSHDDVYKSAKIEHQVSLLAELDSKDRILAGGLEIVDERLKVLYRIDPLKEYTRKQLELGVFALMRGCINGCCLLIPRSLFNEVGVFNENLITTQDFDMFFRLFRNHSIYFNNTFDVLSRCHNEQGSKKLLDFHLQECTTLWKNMIDSLSDQDMIALSGSKFSFLLGTKKFLTDNTLYQDVIDYIDGKLLEELLTSRGRRDLFVDMMHDYWSSEGANERVINSLTAKVLNYRQENSICFLLGDINDRGGLNRVVVEIMNGLAVHYNIMLLTYTEYTVGYDINEKINQVLIDKTIMTNGTWLAKVIKLLNVQVVINNYNCNLSYLELYALSKKYQFNTIAWNHELYFLPYFNPLFRHVVLNRNAYFRNAHSVIWTNKFSYKIYSIFNDNAIYLPNPTTVDRFSVKKERYHNIIAVGRFDDEQKGLTELLEVFSIVIRKNKDIKLHVFGKYDLSLKTPRIEKDLSYDEYIDELAICRDNIVFHGEVANIDAHYGVNDVHVMTSYNEGFGLVILEAASCGVPTVVYSGSAAEDIISDGIDGFVVSYGDSKAMADRILHIFALEDDEYYALSSRVVDMAREYEMPNILEKWHCLLDSCINGSFCLLDYRKNRMVFDYEYSKDLLKDICSRYEITISKTIQDKKTSDFLVDNKGICKLNVVLEKVIMCYRQYGIKYTLQKVIRKLL